MTRFAAMLGAFVGFTALGVWWAAPDRATLGRIADELTGLGAGNVGLLVVLALVVLAGEMVRLAVFGRVIGERVGFRAAFDASIANDLFSWISPLAVLGEPAAVYVMGRRGVSWDGALAISFGKFATGFTVLMPLAGVLFALGHGPAVQTWAVVTIVVTIVLGALLVGTFVIGAVWPRAMLRTTDAVAGWLGRRRLLRGARARRAIDALAGTVRRAIDRLARFRSAGALGWLAILATHVFYYGSYVALLLVLAEMFGAASVWQLVPLAIVYQAFTYIAPAPGIPEAGAAAFFAAQLPDGGAFATVLLFRTLTAYLQVGLGLVYLPIQGMLRAILEQRPR